MGRRVGTTCIETQVICRLAGIPSSTLDYWIRTGLVRPSVRGSSGKRVTRLWTVKDAVTVRAIKALRDAGCPVRDLKRARDRLRDEWEPSLDGKLLYWDGRDLMSIGEWGEVVSLVRRPGQQAFRIVALPLDVWRNEISAEVVSLRARPKKTVPQASGPAGQSRRGAAG